VFTDSGGTKIGERGHLPFGEIRYDTLPASKWKFTTYERDSESSLDYAIFRYHSSRLGRFQSPDPLAGTIRNPQSLNRYAYVLNDPISLTDPLGLAVECVTVCFWSPDPGDPSGFSGTFWCRTTCSGSYGPTPPQDIGLGFWYDSIAMLWDLIAGGFGPGVGPVPPPPGAMPPPPPIHCSKKFREMAAAAWMKAGGGIKRGEAGFQVRGSTAVPTYVPQPYTNEPHKISGWDIHENTVLVFHTHPNSGSPYPLGLDQEVRRPGGSLVPVYAGSSKGLYVTDPSDPKGYRLLREGLDWVDPCP
jgi:RHS repeat-associated protein